MSSTERRYVIRLSAEGAAKLEADMKRLGIEGKGSFDRIKKAADPASAGLRALSRASAEARVQLTGLAGTVPGVSRLAGVLGVTALTTGLIAMGRSTLRVAADYEAAMNRVRVATGATADEMAGLDKIARRLGETTAFSALQAADAIEALAKNGVAISDILGGALDATVTLAGAMGAELAPSANLVTDVMQQFKLQAADLPHVADLVAGAALTSKFGFDELRMAIGQTGGVAGGFGVSLEDMLTSLSGTAAAFASGQDAGTSFKTFLQRLTPQSKEAQAALDQLGIRFFDQSGRMKDMAAIAGELQAGIKGLSEQARNEALGQIFGTDAVRTALMLAELGADGFHDLAKSIGEVSAADQAAVRLTGLTGALKELSAAWVALQLKAADQGGLSTAEGAIRRVTEAIRYLIEHFQEVDEVVGRVAQALGVFLVARGLSRAMAAAISVRAVYIALAQSLGATASASGVAAAGMGRLAIGMRALTGAIGGPMALVTTAATILSLMVNTDAAADAVDRAAEASARGTEALDKYREAARKAAEEQETMGGKISEATLKMLAQSRAQLAQALTDQKLANADAMRALTKGSWFDLKMGSPAGDFIDAISEANFWRQDRNDRIAATGRTDTERLNPYSTAIADLQRDMIAGKASVEEFVAAFDGLRAVDAYMAELAMSVSHLAGAGQLMEAGNAGLVARMTELATGTGQFKEELAAIKSAETDPERLQAWAKLATAVLYAAETGETLRSEQLKGYRDLLGPMADATANEKLLNDAMQETLDQSAELAATGGDGFTAIVEGAAAATAGINTLNSAYLEYGRSRAISDAAVRGEDLAAARKGGMLDLIGFAEGTDKGRGYNETLSYGAFTGGDVNLINMTLTEILELQRQMLAHPDNSYNSSAVGRYQIVSTTLEGLMKSLGLSGEELFTPAMQDRLATELLREVGRNPAALGQTWVGLQGVDNKSILDAWDGKPIDRVDAGVLAAQTEATKALAEAEKERLAVIDRLVASGNQMALDMEFQNSLNGKSAAEVARLTYVYAQLNIAKAGGIDVDAALVASGETVRQMIERQAEAKYRDAAAEEARGQAIADNQAEFDSARSMLEQTFEGLRSGSLSVAGAFGNMADYIGQRLFKLALDPVWDALARGISGLIGGIFGLADGGSLGALAAGGPIGSFADGGRMFGGRARGPIGGRGGKRQDNILLWGSRGEFMQPAAAVDWYGMDFMEAVRTRQLPRYADGGLVSGGGGGGGFAVAAAPPQSRDITVNVNISGARGNREIEEAVRTGVRTGISEYDRHALPVRLAQISADPRKRG